MAVARRAAVDLDQTGAHPGETPLIATQLGHEGIFRMEAGEDGERADEQRAELLYWVAEHGHGGIVALLVKAGAAVDQHTFYTKNAVLHSHA
jgi:hypothetical protein